MHYKIELDSLNIFIEVVIKLYNKFYKLAIETCYCKVNGKLKLYYRYANY